MHVFAEAHSITDPARNAVLRYESAHKQRLPNTWLIWFTDFVRYFKNFILRRHALQFQMGKWISFNVCLQISGSPGTVYTQPMLNFGDSYSGYCGRSFDFPVSAVGRDHSRYGNVPVSLMCPFSLNCGEISWILASNSQCTRKTCYIKRSPLMAQQLRDFLLDETQSRLTANPCFLKQQNQLISEIFLHSAILHDRFGQEIVKV